ncbi:hypothetical protein J6590_019013 [Homalodisca vitripennis]|nr:hypothetical protein J6590_019013 [Homalodisca vitripennis]
MMQIKCFNITDTFRRYKNSDTSLYTDLCATKEMVPRNVREGREKCFAAKTSTRERKYKPHNGCPALRENTSTLLHSVIISHLRIFRTSLTRILAHHINVQRENTSTPSTR